MNSSPLPNHSEPENGKEGLPWFVSAMPDRYLRFPEHYLYQTALAVEQLEDTAERRKQFKTLFTRRLLSRGFPLPEPGQEEINSFITSGGQTSQLQRSTAIADLALQYLSEKKTFADSVRLAILELFTREQPLRPYTMDSFYFTNPELVQSDLTQFALQRGPDKTPADLSTDSSKHSSSVLCSSGESVRWEAYLRRAAVPLGLARTTEEAGGKLAETLRLLKKTAGLVVQEYSSMNASYFTNPEFVRNDLIRFAEQLGEGKTPHDLIIGKKCASLTVACSNGESITWGTYLLRAAAVFSCSKKQKESAIKPAETLVLLKKTAGLIVQEYPKMDHPYFNDQKSVLYDLTRFALQLGPDKTPADLTANTKKYSSPVLCSNGESVRWNAYLRRAAVALGLARTTEEAGGKLAETLRLLKKTAGLIVQEYPKMDHPYFNDQKSVLYDLTQFALQRGSDKTPADLTANTKKYSSPAICSNGESVTWATYLSRAAVALGLVPNAKEAQGKLAETLRLLKKTAGY